ncbi:RNA-binding protein [Kitasatospora sp. NPDC051853]|uniref:RNA-binding protein n=1 Tax=Kitasatospora sp. NPDC051853 TaxID=3364058 RepID=UPI003788CA35
MPELRVHRVTKYDPADRDENGWYVGPLDVDCDEGPIEAAYLETAAAFARAAGVERLTVRDPGGTAVDDWSGPAAERTGAAGLFAEPTGFHDGAEVDLATGIELVRAMLRESGGWCRLEAGDRFFVHVGWDLYMYVGTAGPVGPGVERARELGLFPEPLDESPYAPEPDGSASEVPADAAYWERLERAVAAGGVRLLQEYFAGSAARWHRLEAEGDVAAVRARLVPRSRLSAWPSLFGAAPAEVLGGLDPEGYHHLLVEHPGGVLSGCWVDLEDAEDTAVLDGAVRLALVPEGPGALPDAVLPDADGVVRVRGYG